MTAVVGIPRADSPIGQVVLTQTVAVEILQGSGKPVMWGHMPLVNHMEVPVVSPGDKQRSLKCKGKGHFLNPVRSDGEQPNLIMKTIEKKGQRQRMVVMVVRIHP
jgi:hypothetical protein